MDRIVIVEDSPDDRELLASFCRDWRDFRCDIVASGEEALELLADVSARCVVLDYRLDGEDGLEVLDRLRAVRPGIPAILLTGEGSELLEADSIRAGVARYLAKRGLTSETFHTAVNLTILAADRIQAEPGDADDEHLQPEKTHR